MKTNRLSVLVACNLISACGVAALPTPASAQKSGQVNKKGAAAAPGQAPTAEQQKTLRALGVDPKRPARKPVFVEMPKIDLNVPVFSDENTGFALRDLPKPDPI